MTYIIGVSAFYHDSSACLFKNGELVFACEEEKFTGIKHDSSFPIKTLEYIFKVYKLTKKDIECICYYEDPKLKMERVSNNIKRQFYKHPYYSLMSHLNIKNNVKQLNKLLPIYSDNVFYSTHHESHLYYSYYTSHFSDSICLSVDGVGEIDTMSLGIPSDTGINYTSLSRYPHSLGLFYSAMTAFVGFKPNEGEYKMMGLAPYGDSKKYMDKVRKLISYEDGELKCNMDVFCWDRSNSTMFNEKLEKLLGIDSRIPGGEVDCEYMDLSASVQRIYEEILFKVINKTSELSNTTNLTLGGGCAYNGTANGKISSNTPFKNLWIPPAPSDAGSAIGACVNYLVKNNKLKGKINRSPFLGPYYYNNTILNALKGCKHFKFNSEESLIRNVAKKLKEGKVIGWYQDKIEFGSRALGNRSILADPTRPDMKDKINKVIKKRESFRPFAPMVIKEKQNIFFDMEDDIPYMNQIVNVKKEHRNNLPSITHIDGSARVQTVYKDNMIYTLLVEFEKLSGFPILLNTSFNVKDKTMVLTPKDAIKTFYDTEMDFLVIGRYLIYK